MRLGSAVIMARAWKPSISNLFLAILTTAVSFGDAQSTSKCYFNASCKSHVFHALLQDGWKVIGMVF